MRFRGRSGSRWGGRIFLCAALTTTVFGSCVASAQAGDQVTIKPGSSSGTFTGTDKNTGANTHNFISIGTSAQENNPITSFTYNGQQCQLYSKQGSAYCSTNLPPGATATFSGTTQSTTTGFVFCTSDDSGLDNTCNPVTASNTTPPPTTCTPKSVSESFLELDIEIQRVINQAHGGTLTGSALVGAIAKLEKAKLALITPQNFGGTVWGVRASTVVHSLAILDKLLGLAQGLAAGGHTGQAVGDLKLARDVKKGLEKLIKEHGSAGSDITNDLINLDIEIQRVINQAHGGTLTGSALVGAIAKLEKAKLALITPQNFGGTVWGVRASTVVHSLAILDKLLGLAQGLAAGGHTGQAVGDLKLARDVKKGLEKLITEHGCR